MKKLLCTLTAISFPIAANATPPKTIPDATVQATIEKFKPDFCQNGWKSFAETMADCYDKSNAKDSQINQCILADLATQQSIKKMDKKNRALGRPPVWLQYHAKFLEQYSFSKRVNYYIKPTLTEQGIDETYYTDKAINQFNQALEKCDNK